MATTRYKITEQVRRLLTGGDPSASSVKNEEIREAIGQVLNKALKTDIFKVNLPSGETIPDGYVMAHYTDIPVVRWQNRSRSQLPAIPVSLPRNMGVYHVGPAGDLDSFYVPIPPGQVAFSKRQPLINDLTDLIAYEVRDGWVIYNKDITDPNAEVKVDITLVVADMSHYGDYDILPIPADMEADVIQAVYQLFATQPAPDNKVDSTAEPTKY